MHDILVIFTILIFALTTLFIMWRPQGINEAVPAFIGFTVLFIFGVISFSDIIIVLGIVSGPAITIISTIIMCIVLESIGIFRWAAYNIVNRAKGSGILLFWYTIILCFLMTIFFNNDASILITTPIIIHIVTILRIKKRQKLPYLFSGVFIATAASLSIGVSNISNLIGLGIVGLDLITYSNMIFVPSMIGVITLSLLLFLLFKKDIPKKIPSYNNEPPKFLLSNMLGKDTHPLSNDMIHSGLINWQLFRVCIVIVILVRGSYFLLTPLGIQQEWIAILGALILIGIRWVKMDKGVYDILKKAPWHILIFAFGMYAIVFALNNTGITSTLVEVLKEPMSQNLVFATFISGFLATLLSNVLNNLPSVMLATLMISEMGLEQLTLQASFISIIIGSNKGALLTPMGTLATLLWMFLLRRNGIYVSWWQYIKVAILVVPITLIVTLLSLYLWIYFIYL